MNVLLVMPSYNMFKPDNRSYHISMGMMYISAYLKTKRDNVYCLNLNHYTPDSLRTYLERGNFSVVCTGGLFTDFDPIKYVIDETKKYNPNIKVVVGGAIGSAHPEFALQALGADYIVIGEGEITLSRLLDAIEFNTDCREVPGIAFKDNGHFVQTPAARPIEDLSVIPLPDYDSFEYGKYIEQVERNQWGYNHVNENVKFAFLVTGRDCPSKCTFCFRSLGGNRVRLRSVESVMEEIIFLKEKYGITGINILDDVFAINRERVFKFCELVKPLNLTWCLQMRVTMANEEMLTAMKDAGCYMVSYGIESGSQTVLKSMKKGITVGAIDKALAITRKVGLVIQGNFIFGDPAENYDTVNETVDFYHRHLDYNINVLMLRPYPGTELYFNLLKEGKIRNLLHFWKNEAVNEDGTTINMTKLNDKDFYTLLNSFVSRTFDKMYGTILSHNPSPNKRDEAFIEVKCPVCRTDSSGLLKRWVDTMAICPHCSAKFPLPM